MPCGFCGQAGHNKRTCETFNAAEIARMVGMAPLSSVPLPSSIACHLTDLACRASRPRAALAIRTLRPQLAEGAATDAVLAACGPFGLAASCMMKAYGVASAVSGWKKMSIKERQRAILAIAVDAM